MNDLCFLINEIKSKVVINDYKADPPCGKDGIIDSLKLLGHKGELVMLQGWKKNGTAVTRSVV